MMRWKKLVVRDLPHDASCEEALSACGFPITYTDSVLRTPIFPSTFFRWEGGKPAKNGRASVPSRLTLQFRKDPDQLEDTLRVLHGKEVTLANGSSIVLSVHVAPNQRLPREKPRRRDNKSNTIAKDPDYLAFLDDLNDPDKKQQQSVVTANDVNEGGDDKVKDKPVSALVKFLNDRRVERRDKGGKYGQRGTSTGFPAETTSSSTRGGKKKHADGKKSAKDKRKEDSRPPKESRGGGGGAKKGKDKKQPRNNTSNGLFTAPDGGGATANLPPSTMDTMQPGMLRIMPKGGTLPTDQQLPLEGGGRGRPRGGGNRSRGGKKAAGRSDGGDPPGGGRGQRHPTNPPSSSSTSVRTPAKYKWIWDILCQILNFCAD
ncbi:hypothetical protein, variant 2 [Aphanomyces astaci]|uniref:UPF3 domain-containing protein n=1 Tax=Aphanomyces astaci TaxID=112090 RepID=W4GIM4_APHAT|nr:hypothetical protein, variant 1 [Aphanomyces astaci]XP_009831370.1 hypothetical protein, variant 2 [Aphanomyces astaci]ETV79527.1 hypothetical protein, variant 1 [Aphanomyces astaci]ETV79528.1 hypothetical protein, variant 2 [Aphanomyces astaci]|eukprot:XP_009831369.1 hypothetical protein, variant 1 [Aphanomyces astaci]